jgi:hypothetical protein
VAWASEAVNLLEKSDFFACKLLKTRGRKNQNSIVSQLLPSAPRRERDAPETAGKMPALRPGGQRPPLQPEATMILECGDSSPLSATATCCGARERADKSAREKGSKLPHSKEVNRNS